MIIPKLKRVKVSSEQELRTWLSKHSPTDQDVMIVTCGKTSPAKHVSSAQVRAAFDTFGWRAGRSYTLDGNLIGHVGGRP